MMMKLLKLSFKRFVSLEFLFHGWMWNICVNFLFSSIQLPAAKEGRQVRFGGSVSETDTGARRVVSRSLSKLPVARRPLASFSKLGELKF
jgi:hypothetical protein